MLIPKVPMREFVDYGFKPCKKPYDNCYYLCVSRGIKMIFVSPVCFMINDWEKDDHRIHKNPNCKYRDNRTAEDILFDLIKKDMLDCNSNVENCQTTETKSINHGQWVRKTWHGRGGYKYLTCECGKVHTIQEPHDEEIIICSQCGKINDSNFDNYCPNCGAKMIE